MRLALGLALPVTLIAQLVPSVGLALVPTATTTRESLLFNARPGPDDQRLRDAAAALDAGDAERARGLLERKTPPIDDYRALLLARAYERLGQPAKAYPLLEAIKAPRHRCAAGEAEHALDLDAALLHARLLAAEQPGAAAEILAAQGPRAALLAEAAALYRRAGEDQKADEIEARLLVETPDAPEARTLAHALKAKGVKARLRTSERRFHRIERLLDTQQNADAKSEGNRLLDEIPAESELRCQLSYIVGKAERKLRQYQTSEQALAAARERCIADGKTDVALRATLLEVQVRAIRGEVERTQRLVEWMAKNHPGHSFLDDALLFYANLLEDAGKPDAARKVYLQIVESMPKGDQGPEAAWRLAYLGIRDDDRPTALQWLNWLVARKDLPAVEHDRARYWTARLLEEKDEARARSLYEAIALEPTFYTWLALEHLEQARPAWAKALKGQLLAIRDQEARAATEGTDSRTRGAAGPDAGVVPGTAWRAPETLTSAAEYERARHLFAAGTKSYAETELGLLDCPDLTDGETLGLSLAFDAIGAHQHAQALLRARAGTMLRGPLTPDALLVWRAAYSRPFFDLVSQAAAEQKIEPLLLLALVREESTFDPQVVSWAGAVGLAQLTPGTAITAHLELGLGRLDLEQLTDPALNLRLGARVLRDDLKAFQSREPLALVAYNGGVGVAERLIERTPKPFERWVEEIGIKETRRYVKRVLETWGLYRFLYDRDRPFIRLPGDIRRG